MLNVADFSSAELLDRDVTQEVLLRTGADELPIYAYLTANGQTRPTMTETFEWPASTLAGRRTQVDNVADDYDETDTTIVVDDGTAVYKNALVLCEATGEIMLVTAVAGDSLTVVRGVGAVIAADAASVADDAYLTCVGHAAGEGASRYAAVQSVPGLAKNIVQTMRKTVELSGRLMRTGLKTEDERARQRKVKLEELARDIEHMILFGAYDAGETDADGRRVSTSGGFLQAITTTVDNVGGAMSWDRFRTFAQAAFAKGSREKLLAAGPTVHAAVHTIAATKYQIQTVNVFGLRLQRIQTEWGDFLLYPHRGLVGAYAGYGIAIDPSQAEIRTLGSTETGTGLPHLRADIHEKDQDGAADEWFCELGLQWGAEDYHAVVKGVTGAA
jgi:hypothetical protein